MIKKNHSETEGLFNAIEYALLGLNEEIKKEYMCETYIKEKLQTIQRTIDYISKIQETIK